MTLWHVTLSTLLPLCEGIHRRQIPLIKGQWCVDLVFSLLLAWASCWTNNWTADAMTLMWRQRNTEDIPVHIDSSFIYHTLSSTTFYFYQRIWTYSSTDTYIYIFMYNWYRYINLYIYVYLGRRSIYQKWIWRYQDTHNDGSGQYCSISNANSLAILQSCTKPSIFKFILLNMYFRHPLHHNCSH